jgi:prolyl oligopeptidase
MRSWMLVGLGLGLAGAAFGGEMATDDPYLWLEDVTGDKSLSWVAERNEASTGELTSSPEFNALRDRLLAAFDSDDRIPFAAKRADQIYNFWQDGQHPRGLWRRTTMDSYRTAAPDWETVIDLDALGEAEGEAWVWHGADCLPPEYRKCLVSLSRGGADADVMREFDTVDKQFVEGGFGLPEAKGGATWLDADTLLVQTDFGAGTLTTSGYPRQVKLWERGAPLDDAPILFEGEAADVAVQAGRDFTPGFERTWVTRAMTFYTSETWVDVDGALFKLDVPEGANAFGWRGWLLVELRADWTVGGKTWKAGSLVATDLEAFLGGGRDFAALFTPTERTALSGVTTTKSAVVLNVLDNVRSRVTVVRPGADGWSSSDLQGLPEFGSIGASAVDAYNSDELFLTITDFLTPTTLSLTSIDGGAPEQLKAMPSYFDASNLEIAQHEATSADGTKIPYFEVSRKDRKLKGKNPTLLYGYGGFEVSMTPSYSASIGMAWLEQGGTYVLANIRGGGEFGPSWHQAALKEKRHKAYEDFIAVGEDLVSRKVTKPAHLGIMGGSNGGLLMGNMLTMRPDLFGAVVCQVPLLDMQRYHTLLAGASWMGEYGDPEDPEQWKYIQTFSPYHNVKAGVNYPRVLFMTSTRDDRVHPGHARKMVARMIEQGHDVLYWENTEGGHGGAANNAQRATMSALAWTFLWNELQ